MGIIPAAGATQTLPRTIGRARTLEAFLTGEWLDAAEAYRVGLVNRLVSRDRLMPMADEIAARIVSLPHQAVKYAKQAITRGLDMSLSEGIELEKRLVALSISAKEKQYGLRNF